MHNLIFKERESRQQRAIIDHQLPELHLYPGNQCNRTCSFCTVLASPHGSYLPFSPKLLDAVLQVVMLHPQGTVKFYGGEPTLHHDHVISAIAYLRSHGFDGAIVIYSNGILAQQLLNILEADPSHNTTASLNYSITTGDGATPIPTHALQILEDYEKNYPNSITIGHPDIVDAGRGIDPFTGSPSRPKTTHICPRCYPVLKSDGSFHACPFAVENSAPHFHLGDLNTTPSQIVENFQTFLHWLDVIHQPFALSHNLNACSVCHNHLHQLSTPRLLKQKMENQQPQSN
jgi:hypothetical protein